MRQEAAGNEGRGSGSHAHRTGRSVKDFGFSLE